MSYISGTEFSLTFWNEADHLAVGKISIGYHDMDGKSKKKLSSARYFLLFVCNLKYSKIILYRLFIRSIPKLKISTVSRKIESF